MDTLRSQMGFKDSPDDYEDEKFPGAVDQTPSLTPLKPHHPFSTEPQLQQTPNFNPNLTTPTSNNNEDEDDDEEMEMMENPSSATTTSTKKQKPLSAFTGDQPPPPTKKPKKKTNNNVWTKSTSRKGKKKSRSSAPHHPSSLTPQDTVLITPVPRFPDKSDDSPSSTILLSRFHKAEKIDLSDDRLTASSTKGYRMVRATRGVVDGAWFFEIRILRLGGTGHTRLGWATEKGDLQAPVGYDGSSYAFRDVDGSKVHKALRERYAAEGYGEGDVIGFYINLPHGSSYAPKPPHLVWYKGQRYMYSADGKDEAPKVVPGSEISFFKNGVCQGTAFTDIVGGRYYPAASMYTLPDQPSCEVRFNFGPNFEFFPQNFGGRPIPRLMIEVPYHGYDVKVECPTENGFGEKTN